MNANLHYQIKQDFGDIAFSRGLFYQSPNVLRFSLSQEGTPFQRFLMASERCTAICNDIFTGSASLVASIDVPQSDNALNRLRRTLGTMGVSLLGKPEFYPNEDLFASADTDPTVVSRLIFEASAESIKSLVWCALAFDAKIIRPRLSCDIRLFDLHRGILVFPYDDRGVDIVWLRQNPLDLIDDERRRFLMSS